MPNTPPADHSQLDNKTVFETALAEFYLAHLAVICHPDVVLPEHLKTAAWKARKEIVHLEYGLDMPVPITDLEVTDAGVKATLSFSREPFTTFVPWAAVGNFTCEGKRPLPPKAKPKLGLVK